MRIPHDQLSAQALNGIIEEFITREGTDYGQRETPLEEKIRQIKAQIDRGEVIILYDSESQSCNLVPSNTLDT
ncbi:MAG: YheU family protein [Pseudomonadales bacterium]|mgnify:FL=1|jgi:hypothetical protein|nr:YheU family protein [Pseudomonadales bacterium]MDP7596078.1 YheU family protein [Pseudomonadales bacterium]HJN52272.1 YheU family protein [Pseudomonadales bacterium]|tara:strand:+ start:72 stop:290 length:219 start_codon:yes stop_codon:yes gene_type:complete